MRERFAGLSVAEYRRRLSGLGIDHSKVLEREGFVRLLADACTYQNLSGLRVAVLKKRLVAMGVDVRRSHAITKRDLVDLLDEALNTRIASWGT